MYNSGRLCDPRFYWLILPGLVLGLPWFCRSAFALFLSLWSFSWWASTMSWYWAVAGGEEWICRDAGFLATRVIRMLEKLKAGNQGLDIQAKSAFRWSIENLAAWTDDTCGVKETWIILFLEWLYWMVQARGCEVNFRFSFHRECRPRISRTRAFTTVKVSEAPIALFEQINPTDERPTTYPSARYYKWLAWSGINDILHRPLSSSACPLLCSILGCNLSLPSELHWLKSPVK